MAHLRHLVLLTLLTAQVTVGEEPTLVILPENILKAVGQGVYVSCTATVDDTQLVSEMSWTAPDGRRILNNVDNTVSTAEDGTEAKLDLVISKLREQDVGEYTCSATYAGNQKLEAKIMVESFMDIDFGDTPTHQTLLIGQEGKVKCTPKAKPSPQVDWFKNQVSLVNDDSHIIQQDGILITDVTEADEGTYRCRARVLELGSMDQVNIQVEVHIPPVINLPPQDLKGKETESIKFECGATGKPMPSYSWVGKDNQPLEDLEGYHVDRDTGDLIILNLKPEQSGEYRCTASNNAGEDFKTAFLQVLTKPHVEEYLNLTIPVGKEAEMRCVVTGSPEPTVIFKKESEPDSFVSGINTDDRISVTQETDDQGRQVGILKIRDVARSDDGLYTCTAQSEGGVTQRWGHITVEFKPTFEDQGPTEQWSWEKAPVNLTCLATSIPNATIQWYFRGEEIEYSDPNLERKALGPLGVLWVNPVSSALFGIYTCEATNTLGTASLDLELKEAHPPGPITSAKVEKKTATTITWSLVDPADNGGLPIQNYVVQYREFEQPWDGAPLITWTKGSSYTIDKLVPQMTYVFRFKAQSKAGDGEWGGEKSEEMPRHAQPEEPMIFAASGRVVEIPYPSHYDLQWKVPLDNGKEIDHFQIVYYQVKEKEDKWEAIGGKTTQEVEYPGKTTYKIEGLQFNSHYKIELRAHNDIGYSTPAEAIIKTANGSQPGTPAPESGLGIGIIVAIIAIVVLVVLVVLDVSCFFTRNVGLTATIAGKRDSKDKDKEAMLEDGKNASSEDVQEGNGQVKPQKEEDLKPEQEEDTNKKATEPTETTPMIQKHSLQSSALLRQEAFPLRASNQARVLDTSAEAMVQLQPGSLAKRHPQDKPRIEAPRPTRPVIANGPRRAESKEDAHPLSEKSISNNVKHLDNISRCSSEVDNFSDDLSMHDDLLYAKPTYGHATIHTSSRDAMELPPPLPSRNVASCHSRLSREHLQQPGSQDELDILGIPHHSSGSSDLLDKALQNTKVSFGSKDAWRLGREEPTKRAKPQPHHAGRDRDRLNHSRTFALNNASPFPTTRPKEAFTQASSMSGCMLDNRDALNRGNLESNSSMKNYSKELNEKLQAQSLVHDHNDRLQDPSRMRQAYICPGRPPKAPSISSNSTLYQPVDAGYQHYPTQTAYKIAPYDTPDCAAEPLPSPNPFTSQSLEMQPPITRSTSRMMPSTAAHTPRTNEQQQQQQPCLQAPFQSVSHPPCQGEEKKISKTVNRLYFRDTPQQPSHSLSMDHLEGPIDTQWPFSGHHPSEHRSPTISTAKSLNNLLDGSSSSLRCYGQPTLL